MKENPTFGDMFAVMEHKQNEAMAMLHRTFDSSGEDEDFMFASRIVAMMPKTPLDASSIREQDDAMLFMLHACAFIGIVHFLKDRHNDEILHADEPDDLCEGSGEVIHCFQATSGDYVAWINRGPCYSQCPLRAVWMALMYEMGHIVSDDGVTQ